MTTEPVIAFLIVDPPAYFSHLETCEQCRAHPFALCPIGAALVKTIGQTNDDLFRRLQSGDGETLYVLQSLAVSMTVEELQRFCEGSMNALVVVQDQFRKRFPREFAEWDAKF